MQTNRETLLCHYYYDPLDRLAAYKISTQSSVQRFYLKARLTNEIQGTMQRTIFRHDDQLLAQQHRQGGSVGTTFLLATDQQNSVLNVLDAMQPQPISYTPYGHRPPESDVFFPGFNGERLDPVTGDYLLGNGYRAFNPVLMRFNSPDSRSPFEEGGLNAYAYCVGDPVNQVDPTGHMPLSTLLIGILRKFNALRKAVTAGVATPVAKIDQGSFIADFFKTAKQSLSRNSTATPESMSPARQHVENVVKNITSPQPFIKRLEAVNMNLASHGDNTLSMNHAIQYEKLVQEVNAGRLSNTGAHVESAIMWTQQYAQDKTPGSLVGAVFNGLGGTLLSGVHDASLQKTGKALRQS